MQKQIASFLFQNKTCPLPGLGTLALVNTSAETDFTSKQIAAPKPVIQFDNAETDAAGLLTNYLAATTGSSNYEVTEAFDHFCDDLKKQLAEQATVKLDSIGNFFVDGSGNISFKSEELPSAFVQPVYAERVIHPDAEHQILVGDKETTNTVMTEFFSDTTEAKDRWWIWAIVLGVVGLLLVVIYFTQFNGTSAFGNAIKSNAFMIHYTSCPVCNNTSIEEKLKAKEHTVSQKEFSIWQCNACTARFTQDVPGQDEIGAYYASENYISHSDTKKGFINSLYHLVRKRTLGAKRRLVINETGMLKGAILDIGCGTGAFLNTMKEADWNITGLEPDTVARTKAAELYAIHPQESGKLFELPVVSFNAITMWHVLEHVHELHAYIKQIEKLLAPAGKAFIAVPNYTSKDAAIYAAHWAAYDVPRHLYHFSPQSMEKLLSMHGLKLTAVKPMWFDSFYVSMLSEQYKNGKGNIIKAFFNGFLSNLKVLGDTKKCSSVIYVIQSKANQPS